MTHNNWAFSNACPSFVSPYAGNIRKFQQSWDVQTNMVNLEVSVKYINSQEVVSFLMWTADLHCCHFHQKVVKHGSGGRKKIFSDTILKQMNTRQSSGLQPKSIAICTCTEVNLCSRVSRIDKICIIVIMCFINLCLIKLVLH